MITKLLQNLFGIKRKYQKHDEAVIIACFFNPQNSEYRLKAFHRFYDTIKHLNHRIIECVIGDTLPQLPENENITTVYTANLLWHKEALLNKVIAELPAQYKYIFWLDADVIFTNPDWLVQGVKKMQSGYNIIQPFEYCVHLEKDEYEPYFDTKQYYHTIGTSSRPKELWRSFAANCEIDADIAASTNYDVHGHVGFAWGATREVLTQVPLYDKALIGGADHIIAHACAGHIPHKCITKSFTDDIENVHDWSHRFYNVTKGNVGYVPGELWHIWHGDIKKRDYLNRITNFTSQAKGITQKDENGLYVTDDTQALAYMHNYFDTREVTTLNEESHQTEFGGGEFGGGGAGGKFELPSDTENTQQTDSGNHVDNTSSTVITDTVVVESTNFS